MPGVRISESALNIPDLIPMILAGRDRDVAQICFDLWKKGAKVDPDDFLDGLSNLLELDTLGIWDRDIYLFWNDLCKRKVMYMAAVLRAHQLGNVVGCSEEAIKYAIAHHGEGIDLEEVVKAVKEQIPHFDTTMV